MIGFLSPLQESATTRLVLGLASTRKPAPNGTLLAPDEAIRRLRLWDRRFGSGTVRQLLLRADELVSGRTAAGPPGTDLQVWDRITRAIQGGKLVLYEEVVTLPTPKSKPKPAPPPPKPEPPPKKLEWVEIVLLDEEGVPVADEKYSIQLPDGSTREGTLDAEGKARVEEIEPGTCFVTFPEIKVRPRPGDSA